MISTKRWWPTPTPKATPSFFIHGFANNLDANLEHIARLQKLYLSADTGIEQMVYLAWPSSGHKVLTYWNDQEDAIETGRMLGALFSKLCNFFLNLFELHGFDRCYNKIHLRTHSMGNTVLEFMVISIAEPKMFPILGEA